jgi:tetratricopeptide (TPR) repeat protein
MVIARFFALCTRTVAGMRKTLYVLFFCLPVFLFAQKKQGQEQIDSLLTTLQQSHTDSDKVKLLYTVAFQYLVINTDQSLLHLQDAITLAKRTNNKTGLANAYCVLGSVNSIKGNSEEALKNEYAALQLFEETNDKNGIGNCYFSIGEINFKQDKYPDALKYFYAALKLKEQTGNKNAIASCYVNIGNIHNIQNNYAEALSSYSAALKIAEETGKNIVIATSLQNIAYISANEGDNDAALENILAAIKIYQELNDKYGIATCYNKIGHIYNEIKHYDQALKYFTDAEEILKKLGDNLHLADAMGGMGNNFYRQKMYAKAETFYRKELELGTSVGSLASIKDAHLSLSELYEATGMHQKSLSHYKLYVATRDIMYNDENTKKTIREQLQYDFDKKESVAKAEREKKDALMKVELQRKNIYIYGSLAALITLTIIITLMLRQYKLKTDNLRTDLEQKQLRAQMNPHFIFNCLNSIQHFVVANDVKNANKYLSGFALLMRQTLENSKLGDITLANELAYLQNYLSLELMRFEEKFAYKLNCAENINPTETIIPSMIIQPFVENAIKHGLCFLKNKQGLLSISFYVKDKSLYCDIDDNGIGRKESNNLKTPNGKTHKSQGIELTRKRLELMSRKKRSNYEITIHDKTNTLNESEGTTVTIKLPSNL